jgi:SAM-dependent methyltransferase
LQLNARTPANDSNPPVWETNMHAPLSAQPVFANGVLYLNASPYLVAIAETGEPVEISEARERERFPDAVYVPTPQDVVERMLDLAKTTRNDLVVDLGSGDGRIVITAAQRHGSRAIGYELNARLVGISRDTIQHHQLERLARVEHEDMFNADLREADVVALFLPPRLMERLLPQLRKLKPGARIVSHQFIFPDIPPDQTVEMMSAEGQAMHRIHLWTTPLKEAAD